MRRKVRKTYFVGTSQRFVVGSVNFTWSRSAVCCSISTCTVPISGPNAAETTLNTSVWEILIIQKTYWSLGCHCISVSTAQGENLMIMLLRSIISHPDAEICLGNVADDVAISGGLVKTPGIALDTQQNSASQRDLGEMQSSTCFGLQQHPWLSHSDWLMPKYPAVAGWCVEANIHGARIYVAGRVTRTCVWH